MEHLPLRPPVKFIHSRQLLAQGEREIDLLRHLQGVEGVVGFKGHGWWPDPETARCSRGAEGRHRVQLRE